MKQIAKLGFLVVCIFILLGIYVINAPRGRVYDCGMAEWHPDIPPSVKEECRRLHYEYWKEQQEKREQEQSGRKLIRT